MPMKPVYIPRVKGNPTIRQMIKKMTDEIDNWSHVTLIAYTKYFYEQQLFKRSKVDLVRAYLNIFPEDEDK